MPDLPKPITGTRVQVMGETITGIAFSNPEMFPHGLECVVMVPGKLEPLGRVPVPKGTMLAILPPGMSRHLIGALQQAARQQNGTQAPGL